MSQYRKLSQVFFSVNILQTVDFGRGAIGTYAGIDSAKNDDVGVGLAWIGAPVSPYTLLSWTCCVVQLRMEWDFVVHSPGRDDEQGLSS